MSDRLSILINLMGSLGDVSRGLSLLAPIKESYPNTKITWLVEPKCYGLVTLATKIDKIILFQRNNGISAFFELITQLRSEKYDICLDLQRHFKSAVFSKLSGAKKIIGFHRQDSKEFNWIFSTETIPAMPKNLAKLEHYWQFLKKLEINAVPSAKVDLELLAKEQLEKELNIDLETPYLVFNLGSAWHSKDWPEQKYLTLLENLSETRPEYKLILCGAASHQQTSLNLEAKFKDSSINFVNLCAKTNLSQLVSIIAYAKLVFGPDSGPGHLASMLGVPFVGVFGPTDTDRTAPYGEKVSLLTADVSCRPCYRRKCPGMGNICMRLIEVEDVKNKILSYL